ncbi:glycosyltransferase [Alginatibacterium sediminis]|uniref:Glycosyltransferase n=1 Tax=Alginatibacterium sediminis TaxID=2164068 RepID=A0A420E773_9ALTE|nr:glycosyltransferase family 4 protein [Alginatibacterium sediminis]RKF14392.1 glycosyltransferase [Alginatibacterium sediminis]
MKELVGIIGSGNIGRDPFHPRSWSGSSRFFFQALQERKLLKRAFGVEAPSQQRYPLLLKNFHPNRKIWREKFYHDPSYYKALTQEIDRHILDSDFDSDFIQVGAIYDVPSLVKKRSRCFSYHDGDYINAIKSPFRKNLISPQKEKAALDYAAKVYSGLDCVFTMSQFLANSLVEGYGLDAKRVVNIGAGINYALPDLKPKHFNSPEILFVGIDFERKGGPFILECFQDIKDQIPEAKLHIVGPHKLDLPSRLSKGVHYHGFLDKSEAGRAKFQQLLDKASLFVMASLYEPFGIAPLEAMANQIPCLLPDAWAFSEMINEEVNGLLFEPQQQDDFVAKACQILNTDSAGLQLMAQGARKTVLDNYTWDGVALRLENAIDTL